MTIRPTTDVTDAVFEVSDFCLPVRPNQHTLVLLGRARRQKSHLPYSLCSLCGVGKTKACRAGPKIREADQRPNLPDYRPTSEADSV